MQPALAARAQTFVCLICSRLQGPYGLFPIYATKTPSFQAHSSPQAQGLTSRPFHHTRNLAKKKDKEPKIDPQSAKTASSASRAPEDPYDNSELEVSIAKAHSKLKDDHAKLRGGGKFNPEVVENLRVQYDKNNKETARLADLAQCVPRGRVLNIIAGEKDHIKPISHAIQSSDLNLNPQPDAQNPLQLNVQLPPPTTESRNRTVQDAIKFADAANTAIKNARGVQQKRLRAMQLAKSVRPDDLKRAGEKMEKIVADGASAVKNILDMAKKNLESG